MKLLNYKKSRDNNLRNLLGVFSYIGNESTNLEF